MRRPKVAILNEHPTWQLGLHEELDRRDIDFDEIAIEAAYFKLSSDSSSDIDLVINRSSPSAGERKNHASLFFTLYLIEHFERLGIPVINGSRAYALEISKARQCQLFQKLGLPFPQTIILNSPAKTSRAARNLRFPVILKPNIGGSGSGCILFREPRELTEHAAAEAFYKSLDRIAVLQPFLNPDDQKTYRAQTIGPEHRYTVSASGGSFDRCLADDCVKRHDDLHISSSGCNEQRPEFAEHLEDDTVISEVERIAEAGGFDTCGVEYLIHKGKRYYYDINALSVFADPAKIRFSKEIDPTAIFVDVIEQRLAKTFSHTR